MLTFGSVCSGIEAASEAWNPLGWHASFLSEIEAFPRAVLAHRHGGIPLHGDFTTIQAGEYGPVDVLVGGTPCQSFSIAGLRGGMADARGNLALEYLCLAGRLHPRWILWENVPGVLSSNAGRDFGAFLGGLVELGYGFAYRVLDAQYFGLAQRRKRVFVVGYLGDWRRAAAVLFEPASLRGNPAPSREAREGVARPLAAGAPGGSEYRNDADTADNLIAPTLEAGANRTGGVRPPGTTVDTADSLIANALRTPSHGATWRGDGADNLIAHSLRAGGFDASEDGTGRGKSRSYITDQPGRTRALTANRTLAVAFLHVNKGRPAGRQSRHTEMVTVESETIPTLATDGHAQSAIAFQTSQSGMRSSDTHGTLDANNGSRRHNGAVVGSGVRRLTPRECERLQGFPDDYTLIPMARSTQKRVEADFAAHLRRAMPGISDEELRRLSADGPRYRALGNSMAVPVIRWIGRRIQMVDEMEVIGRAILAAERPL